MQFARQGGAPTKFPRARAAGGGEKLGRSAWVLLGVVFIAFLMVQPVRAAPPAVSYPDQANDLARWRYVVSIDPYWYVNGPPIPRDSAIGKAGYCDILEASLTSDENSYYFEMTVAGRLPSQGIIPGVNYVIWSFAPQFDAPGTDWNYFNGGDVVLQWDGAEYRGIFWDTRPVLQGDGITETNLAFSVDGSSLTVTVPKNLFGQDSFYWFFRVVVLGGQYNPYTGKGGPFIVVDTTDPQFAVNPIPYPGYYYPWLLWPA